MSGEPVNEVVLAAVGLVRDDNDVPPRREQGILLSPLGEELLDHCEHISARRYLEEFLQLVPGLGLDGSLPQGRLTNLSFADN